MCFLCLPCICDDSEERSDDEPCEDSELWEEDWELWEEEEECEDPPELELCEEDPDE